MAVQTQWRSNGMSRDGLDRYGVESVIGERRRWRLHRRRLLGELRIMECAALDEWAAKALRNGA